jgi:alpha-tubulin suppressor-like RCC1 family protein
VGDASVVEGDFKNRAAHFSVTLSQPDTTTSVTVQYVVVGVSATGGDRSIRTPEVDFNDTGGAVQTLTFAPRQVYKNVSVSIYGDTTSESNETFEVRLSNPSPGYVIGRGVGTGTIINDDTPADPTTTRVSVADASVVEGDAGNRKVRFAVTLSKPTIPSLQQVTVDYRIVPLTATGGYAQGPRAANVDINDDNGQTRTLTFSSTATEHTVSVVVFPDINVEPDETFQIQLANVQGPAVLTDPTATGTIFNDDAAPPPSTTTSTTLPTPTDHALWAFGWNNHGQLGDGSTTDAHVPEQIGTDSWASVAASDKHTVAIRNDGTLWAWGDNSNGQLGDGSTTDAHVPEQIGTAKWARVSVGGAGAADTVAIRADGTLWAWGYNGDGQLGDGSTTDSHVPEQVGTATNWASVAAGADNTFAIRTDGTLWAWGSNVDGVLGQGSLTAGPHVPEQIGTANNWVTVATGSVHTVAVRTDGTLWTWGGNEYGQLGDGTAGGPICSVTDACRDAPEQIGTATNWASVAAGGDDTFAIRTDGTLWGWGLNEEGALGDGTTNDSHAPEEVGTATNWATVSAGGVNTAAVRTDGTLWTWGNDLYGQLGDIINYNYRNAPYHVGTASDWATVTSGGLHTVALKT